MSTETSTVEALEKLLDLLNERYPDPLLALEQVEWILQQELCSKEVQTAGAVAATIVELLILPALHRDPDRLKQAMTLQAHFLSAHSEPEIETQDEDWLTASIQAIQGGMPTYIPPQATDSLPRSLFARMTAVLRLIGESEPDVLKSVASWQSGTEATWERVAPFLEQIQAKGHKAAMPPSQRELRALYEALLQISQGYTETLTHLGHTDPALSQPSKEARQFDSQVGKRHFQTLLHSQVMALQKEARSLKAQQEAGRGQAEQLKSRVEQLETSLAQARREQFLDPVTGIPDRFAFMAHLHRHLDRALHLGETFSLLLFHFYELQPLIDGLDKTNKRLQENPEKRLLTAIIQEMRPHLPESAFLARLSGERMVVLLPKLSVSRGEQMGGVIGQALEEVTFQLDDATVLLQVSFGCAAFQSGMNVTQMLETTDRLAAAAHSWREEGQMSARRVHIC